MLTVIAFTGPKRSGKDTAAKVFKEFIEKEYPDIKVMQIGFADELRRHMEIMNPIVAVVPMNTPPDYELHWNEAVKMYEYEQAKDRYPEMRRLMQLYGTEVIRNRVDSNFWISSCLEHIEVEYENGLPEQQDMVALITDMRFRNEFTQTNKAFHSNFKQPFVLVKINRPSARLNNEDSADNHASEDFRWVEKERHITLQNDHTEEHFKENCRALTFNLIGEQYADNTANVTSAPAGP